MAVTNINLYNEIMRALIESADDGAAEPSSGLYTREGVADAMRLKLAEFFNLTQCKVTRGTEKTISVGASETDGPDDLATLREVLFFGADNQYITIPNGSTFEADTLMDDTETPVALPSIYTIDMTPVLLINLVPPPSGGTKVSYTYVPQPGAINTPPTSSNIDLPDDFTPYLKYGVLAELFGKAGETYDPLRAQVAQQMYDLGVEVTKSWVTGTNING